MHRNVVHVPRNSRNRTQMQRPKVKLMLFKIFIEYKKNTRLPGCRDRQTSKLGKQSDTSRLIRKGVGRKFQVQKAGNVQ